MGNGYACYRLRRGRLEAATDEASLLDPPGTAPELDPLRLAEYFANEELSGPRTFFREVRAVLPGEMVICERGQLRRRALPRPRLDLRVADRRWEDTVERCAELLGAAVEHSLSGFDRAAVLMSGGLDSTPVAALAARRLARPDDSSPVTALSWRVSDPAADESGLIRDTAKHVGLELEWIDCDDALPFSDLERWPVHPSTPEQTSYRWFRQRSYARAAELGHRLVLSGDGGDALYGHGRRWAWHLLAARGVGAAVDRLRELAREAGWRRVLRSHLLGPLLPRARSLRRPLSADLTPAARALLRDRPRWPPEIRSARRPRQAERLLALLDAHGGNVERWYTRAFGLERRTPLRDFDLVQFLLAVPDHLLQQGAETRPVLRAAIRGMVPESVRRRRGKASFLASLDRALAPERRPWAAELLLHPDALWRGYLRESSIRGWLESSPRDGAGRSGFVNALHGELWRRKLRREPQPSLDP